MKKIVFTLMFILFLSPSVKASSISTLTDPLECFSIAPSSSTKNIFLNDWGTEEKTCGYTNNLFYQYSNYSSSSLYPCINNFIEIQPNTTYTFTHFDSSLKPIKSPQYNNIYIFDSDFNRLSKIQNWFTPPYNFTTPENAKYFLYCANNVSVSHALSNTAILNFQLEANNITSTSDLTFEAYQEYISETDKPDDSEQVIPNSTLTDFYTIFNSKLKLLASYSLENNYLFSAIGILILFTVLYLFLYLFNRGGYRR